MSTHKNVIRFTFDCPIELHTAAKMKALALKQSLKDYLIGLLAKDAVRNPPKFLDEKAFKKELKKILHDDTELMQKLSRL
jgi:hypothetical protein